MSKYLKVLTKKKVLYPSQICPVMFRNRFLFKLVFGDVTNSFLLKNRLNFYETEETRPKVKMLTRLNFLVIDIYYDTLTSSILNYVLFEKLIILRINHVIYDIQVNLGLFRYLYNIDLDLDNFRQFFHYGSTNKWLSQLNPNVYINDMSQLENVNLKLKNRLLVRFQLVRTRVSFSQVYEYTDEDLCLFKDFPHKRLVLPLIVPGRILACTCTLKWLQMYTHLYEKTDFGKRTLVLRVIFITCNMTFFLFGIDNVIFKKPIKTIRTVNIIMLSF